MTDCSNCGNSHDGNYGSGRFCSSKCARGFATKVKRLKINAKVSKALMKLKVEVHCKQCSNLFSSRKKSHLFCSRSCATTFSMLNGLGQKLGRLSASKKVKRSNNEVLFAELCKTKFSNVRTNEPIFNGWDADIILENEKVAVLWNGPWHYKEMGFGNHSLKQVQNRDAIKASEIKKAGYKLYIIKDMGKSNKHFVEKEFRKFCGEV